MSVEHVDKKPKLEELKHCHWDETRPRVLGLGENIIEVSGKTLCVKSIKESMPFYQDILKFKVDPTFEQNDETVTFHCENGFHVTLIVGEPLAFAAENLIVSHMAMDLPNPNPEPEKKKILHTEAELKAQAEQDIKDAEAAYKAKEGDWAKAERDAKFAREHPDEAEKKKRAAEKEREKNQDPNDIILQTFKYLRSKNIPFEINVSVSTGGGDSFAKSGKFDHTVGQAFIRDPSGYYYEFCNCFKINDFVLGKKEKDYLTEDGYLHAYHWIFSRHQGSTSIDWKKVEQWKYLMIHVMYQKIIHAKKRVRERKANPEKFYVEPIPEDQWKPIDGDKEFEKKVENMMKRALIYQNLVQSFDEESKDRTKDMKDMNHHAKLRAVVTKILRQAGHSCPKAILLMQQMIAKGDVKKMAQPPPFFIGDTDSKHSYTPEQLANRVAEKGLHKFAEHLTAGEKDKWDKFLKDTKSDVLEAPKDFKIAGFNHIGLIVKNIGVETAFLSDVIGLQDVMRPNFDTHGEWFTGGNLEIHLIEGNPMVPDKALPASKANAISLLVKDLASAKEVLKKKCAEFDSWLTKLKTETELNGWDPKPLQYEEDEKACFARSPHGYVWKIHE